MEGRGEDGGGSEEDSYFDAEEDGVAKRHARTDGDGVCGMRDRFGTDDEEDSKSMIVSSSDHEYTVSWFKTVMEVGDITRKLCCTFSLKNLMFWHSINWLTIGILCFFFPSLYGMFFNGGVYEGAAGGRATMLRLYSSTLLANVVILWFCGRGASVTNIPYFVVSYSVAFNLEAAGWIRASVYSDGKVSASAWVYAGVWLAYGVSYSWYFFFPSENARNGNEGEAANRDSVERIDSTTLRRTSMSAEAETEKLLRPWDGGSFLRHCFLIQGLISFSLGIFGLMFPRVYGAVFEESMNSFATHAFLIICQHYSSLLLAQAILLCMVATQDNRQIRRRFVMAYACCHWASLLAMTMRFFISGASHSAWFFLCCAVNAAFAAVYTYHWRGFYLWAKTGNGDGHVSSWNFGRYERDGTHHVYDDGVSENTPLTT